MDPIIKFQNWYEQERNITNTLIPSACCLSTTGLDGYPNARFVSLKEVVGGQFIVTGPLDSRKCKEVMYKPHAALTFWWSATGKQVRVQGDVKLIDSEDADRYFSDRTRESQIVSWVSTQGKPVENGSSLKERFDHFSNLNTGEEIPRPENWGGIGIVPVRIEFLVFSPERFHERLLYVRNGTGWSEQYLQP